MLALNQGEEKKKRKQRTKQKGLDMPHATISC
jgi:hypothetical protein